MLSFLNWNEILQSFGFVNIKNHPSETLKAVFHRVLLSVHFSFVYDLSISETAGIFLHKLLYNLQRVVQKRANIQRAAVLWVNMLVDAGGE